MDTLLLKVLIQLSLFSICCVWTRRAFWLYSIGKKNSPLKALTDATKSSSPKVSVIVPAKNEEKNIGRCLKSLFVQNYPNYEIIVVDDRSDDATPHLLENFKTLSPVPFKIIRIEKLPPGWTGKNHGQHTASKTASGEWLLFTDADTTHKPESVATAVNTALDKKIDFLTLAPETECHSFWEKTVQPLAVSSIALWFPHGKLANGQFILVKKDVYEKSGGNEGVKLAVVEDVALAKNVKNSGFRVEFLNGTELYSTRMYSSLQQIKTGWTRIFTHLFEKSIPAILHKIFLFLFFSLLPFALLFYPDLEVLLSALITTVIIIMIRFAGNRMVKTNPWYAFLHPLASLVMLWILLICLWRVLFNRPSPWRGDLLK